MKKLMALITFVFIGAIAASAQSTTLAKDTIVTGIHETPSIQVYPNPASKYIMVSENFNSLSIINVEGTTILTSSNKSTDISQIAKGLYFVVVYTQNEKIIAKIAINN